MPFSPLSASLPSSSGTIDKREASPTSETPQHPRLAVILGIDRRFHYPLLACRSLCFCPSLYGGLKCTAAVWRVFNRRGPAVSPAEVGCVTAELWLAILWCSLSAHFSFLFIDSLMSRWLIHYTPWATLVRLVSICTINVYITSWILTLAGTTRNPRMLLPAWIFIACVLIIAYYITQRNIKVVRHRSEQGRLLRTLTSISRLVAGGSFITMGVLLIELHMLTPGGAFSKPLQA